MDALSVSRVRADEQARALAALVLAFTQDPFERWMYPDAGQYLAYFPEFLAAFGGTASDEGTVWSLGGQLMEPCLRFVDESHLRAYLESPNPRNVSFSERHGFELTGVAKVGACPPVAFMLRAAR